MRRPVTTVLTVVLVAALSGCSGDDAPLADELSRYTDSGDGCRQTVVAITYADGSLRSAGQEQHQEFSDSVRSNISTVAATIALEVHDFPSERVLGQARKVADLAERTGALDTRGQERVRLLREYRREAAQLVIDCAREVDGL